NPVPQHHPPEMPSDPRLLPSDLAALARDCDIYDSTSIPWGLSRYPLRLHACAHTRVSPCDRGHAWLWRLDWRRPPQLRQQAIAQAAPGAWHGERREQRTLLRSNAAYAESALARGAKRYEFRSGWRCARRYGWRSSSRR